MGTAIANGLGATQETLGDQARRFYNERLRAVVETETNIGKMLVLDVDTGEYAIDPTGISASRELQAKNPNARLFRIRIGYMASAAIGGMME
jgi:hypothetical protein